MTGPPSARGGIRGGAASGRGAGRGRGRGSGGRGGAAAEYRKRDIMDGLLPDIVQTIPKPVDIPGELGVEISDVEYVASYTWLDTNKPTIAVPGEPISLYPVRWISYRPHRLAPALVAASAAHPSRARQWAHLRRPERLPAWPTRARPALRCRRCPQRAHRAHVENEYIQIAKDTRRALSDLMIADIDLKNAEARRAVSSAQLEKARIGKLGIDFIAGA